jgi:hypothetical protein
MRFRFAARVAERARVLLSKAEKPAGMAGFFFFYPKFRISCGGGKICQLSLRFLVCKWFGIRVCYFGFWDWGLTVFRDFGVLGVGRIGPDSQAEVDPIWTVPLMVTCRRNPRFCLHFRSSPSAMIRQNETPW